MIDIREADRLIEAHTRRFPTVECALAEAEGRFLREDIRADRDQPPYDRVAMDGIALSTAAVAVGLGEFATEATQAAGDPPLVLASVERCIEVMTGGVLPRGCDTVVRVEDVERHGGIAVLRADAKPAWMANVHRKGTDCAAGDVVVPRGSRLTPAHIAIAAAMGHTRLRVSARPRVAVISTGDELVDVAAVPADHQVRGSNGHAVRAALHGSGLGEAALFHLPDDRPTLLRELAVILDAFDVLVLSGGVSMGRFDFVPDTLAALGVEPVFHKVRQRPGKPLWFGTRDGQPVFALPGNPVATLASLYRYVLPYLVRASGGRPPRRRVRLAGAVRTLTGLASFVPVTFTEDGGGLEAEAVYTNGSGDFLTLSRTDGFVEVEPSVDPVPAGAERPFYPWRLT